MNNEDEVMMSILKRLDVIERGMRHVIKASRMMLTGFVIFTVIFAGSVLLFA